MNQRVILEASTPKVARY